MEKGIGMGLEKKRERRGREEKGATEREANEGEDGKRGAVFELPGGVGGLNPPTVFSNPLTHCEIMYWGSAICYIHMIYITILDRPLKSSTPCQFFTIQTLERRDHLLTRCSVSQSDH